MPDINDPNGARDPIPVKQSFFLGPYGWVPILIVGTILMAMFIFLPATQNNPTVKVTEKPVYRAN